MARIIEKACAGLVALLAAGLLCQPLALAGESAGARDGSRAADANAVGGQGAAGAETTPGDAPQTPKAAPDPEEQERLAKIAEFQKKALDLIADRNYESKSSAHYVVRTDDPRVDVVAVSAFLERFRSFFESVASKLGPLHDQGPPVEVLLFYSRYKYDRLYTEVFGFDNPVGPVGHYRAGQDILAVHTDSVAPADLPGTLTHEAAHQLVQEGLYGTKAKGWTSWVAEGLDYYFQLTRMDRHGTFHDGEIGGQEVNILRDVPVRRAREPRTRLDMFRKFLKETEPGFIDDLFVEQVQSAFYATDASKHQNMAWLMIHFLLHGEDGALVGPLREYISRDARREGGSEVFYKLIGMSPEKLETEFTAYVKKLKSR